VRKPLQVLLGYLIRRMDGLDRKVPAPTSINV
jgi:hypothetical protein